MEALNHFDEISANGKSGLYSLLGSTYAQSGNMNKRDEFFHKAIDFNTSNPEVDSFFISSAFNNYAEALFDNGEIDSAKVNYERALRFSEYDYADKLIKGNLGMVNVHLGLFDQAKKQLTIAIEYAKKAFGASTQSIFIYNLGDAYFKNGQLDSALLLYRESLDIALENGLYEEIRDAGLRMYQYYEATGEYDKALNYHKLHVQYRDSVQNVENVREVSELRADFEISQKQVEVDLLAAQKELREIILYGTVVVIFILILAAIFIYRNYRTKNQLALELANQKMELERINNTKDKLFSIVSHDLRGPIAAFSGVTRMINYFAKTKSTDQLTELSEEIEKSVKNLSSLLDNLLTWAMQQRGALAYVPEKIKVRNSFVNLFDNVSTMAESKSIELKMDIPEDLEIKADKNMVETIFRNLVTNALKFTPEKGKVSVSGFSENGKTLITIQDTGVGIPQEKLETLFELRDKKSTYGTKGEKGLGLGLQLVKEFTDLNEAELKVESELNKGTKFSISFQS